MKISSKILNELRKKHNMSGWYYNSTGIDNADIALLAIFHLYHQGIINRAKFIACCRQYRDETLVRKVNTYRCSINGKWYGDDSTLTAILDSYFELCRLEDMDVEDILKYLNLTLNKNRNYCIDHLYFQYIAPLYHLIEYKLEFFNTLDLHSAIESYDDMNRRGILSSGYCCDDCDGCLGEYKRNTYRRLVGYDYKDKVEKEIKSYFNSLKTKSASGNMLNKLL